MGIQEQWDAVERIARERGIGLSERVAQESFYWDGTSVALLDIPGVRMRPSSVLHEISHWIVASDHERATPEYGMVPRPAIICEGGGGRMRRAYEERVKRSAFLTETERRERECAAQVVNQLLGLAHGIPSVFRYGWKEASKNMSKVLPDWERMGLTHLWKTGVMALSNPLRSHSAEVRFDVTYPGLEVTRWLSSSGQ